MTELPDPYKRLSALGLDLPQAPTPVANFLAAVKVGNLLFLSGQGPFDARTGWKLGKVGSDFTAEQAYEHARIVGLNLLGVLHHELGSLNRVSRIVKVFGMVNAVDGFAMHPAVVNGCSDLFRAVFGDEVGAHARSAVGVGSLPGNISVEIEVVVAITD
jgi:enamine deaminase RidA (YjgF/YER057c/UK114 family)